MLVVVQNYSKHVQDSDVTLMAAAWTSQIRNHVAPFWGRSSVTVVAMPKDATLPDGARQLAIVDTPDVANALGYHDVDKHGRPYGRVFVEPILDNGGTVMTGGNSVPVTGSHEVLEMFGDWWANYWADAPNGNSYALELCDAVESDFYTVKVKGHPIPVSNFVLPAFFEKVPETEEFDRLGKLKAPFTYDEGGYLIYFRDGKVQTTFGAKYPEWKKELKTAHPSSRLAMRVAA